MITKQRLISDFQDIGINPNGTLLVHSSMKAIGDVEGGADTVLDALSEFMSEGLLLLPTHSWDKHNLANGIYDPKTEPSCVGILGEMFRQREGVLRSLHPTHSMAALGKNAEQFIAGEETLTSPCPRHGAWGRLYDVDAQILFLGCPLTRNTYIHGVEEWSAIPNRIDSESEAPSRLLKVMRLLRRFCVAIKVRLVAFMKTMTSLSVHLLNKVSAIGGLLARQDRF